MWFRGGLIFEAHRLLIHVVPVVVTTTANFPGGPCSDREESHAKTLTIYRLGLNQNFYTFASTLLIMTVMCSQFH